MIRQNAKSGIHARAIVLPTTTYVTSGVRAADVFMVSANWKVD